ncbi:protein of unknown function DUF1559 [Planctopirus limnophila DSM 3776]|uniref:DUF1559 domain-containing protein n=1 Tax=Planctopirus limnophila (strain ATCC 43296 / DSM 3776 / IFAM 1008 / Mu 290) TaxID=521674 RepID=D5SP99_PLAL2|nr:DUF1559 domain-containing protein [Planctopirus limnophila]ADG68243.1 protein of unknown function DUF1559 [Planctopirus limnophila DSM 3776]
MKSTSLDQRSTRRGFTALELIVALGVIVALVLFLMPATRRGREAARRTQCRNNLKQIGLALHNYHDQHGVFPPAFTVDAAGKPLHSWRTLILPYLDQAALYDSIDLSKPWDDPANAHAKETALACYRCRSSMLPAGMTTYVGVVGEQNFFSPNHPRKLSEFPPDKTFQLIAIFERDDQRAVHWMSPEDGTAAELLTPPADRKTVHTGGFNSLLANERVYFVSKDLPQETLKSLLSIDAPLLKDDF